MNRNHCVPDFDFDDKNGISPSAGLTRSKKSAVAERDVMELLWQNGRVVFHSQKQRSLRKSNIGEAFIPAENSAARQIRPEEDSAANLFMQEDETTTWLHYPLDETSFERDLYADLFYPAPSAPASTPSRPAPVADARTAEFKRPRPPAPTAAPPVHNFSHFSRHKGRGEPGPSSSNKTARESTVVDSSDTPALAAVPESRISHVSNSTAQMSGGTLGWWTMSATAALGTSSAAGGETETRTCDLTVTSSPGGSGASASGSAEPTQKPAPPVREDRKRKGREADDAEWQSEDVEFEYPDVKKQVRGSTSMKRSRAAEVHNLSERRRRDRINEKMRTLQELIPRCNKSDKASMLDEAIEYLKSLQLQVQMMSMGCTMVPMMFPGVQHYMPTMGMGMDMGMTRPMMQFSSVLPGSGLPNPAAHLAPRFPMPAFHVPLGALPDPNRIQATSLPDSVLNSDGVQYLNQPRMQYLADPYQQYLSLHQTQVSPAQNHSVIQPSMGKPSGGSNHGNLQSG